jgi:hypothetical protein
MAGSAAQVDWYQIDWDDWRARHASLTFADQQAFYQRVAEIYPHQQSFDAALCHDAFDFIAGEDLDVLELGGWDGALAGLMLGRSDVSRWTNCDLIEVPQVCRHEGYVLHVLQDYLWYMPERRADVFVACHTIEHLSVAELSKLFDWVRAAYVYLEAPIGAVGKDWRGYPGSHILDIGWIEVRAMLEKRGYHWVAENLWRFEP